MANRKNHRWFDEIRESGAIVFCLLEQAKERAKNVRAAIDCYRAAVEQGIPVIAVRENRSRMKNELERLGFAAGELFIAENYPEAVGIVTALRKGGRRDFRFSISD